MTQVPTKIASTTNATSSPSASSPSEPFDSSWNEGLNERRCVLIDKEIQGNISDDERRELEGLVERMRAHRRRVAGLPIDEAKLLHRRLLELQEAASDTPDDHIRNEIPNDVKRSDPNALAENFAVALRVFDKVANDLRRRARPLKAFEDRCRQSLQIAYELFPSAPAWVCFFRETLAEGGLVRKLFQNGQEFADFTTTSEYVEISRMLTALRSREQPENDPNDPQRMITVRMPKSLHETVCNEAERLAISVNKLIISRMLQPLDSRMIPQSTAKRRQPKSRKSD